MLICLLLVWTDLGCISDTAVTPLFLYQTAGNTSKKAFRCFLVAGSMSFFPGIFESSWFCLKTHCLFHGEAQRESLNSCKENSVHLQLPGYRNTSGNTAMQMSRYSVTTFTHPAQSSSAALSDIHIRKSKLSPHMKLFSHPDTCTQVEECFRCMRACALSSFSSVFPQATPAAPLLPFQDLCPVCLVPPRMILQPSLLSVRNLCRILISSVPSHQDAAADFKQLLWRITAYPWLYQHILHKDLRFVCQTAGHHFSSLPSADTDFYSTGSPEHIGEYDHYYRLNHHKAALKGNVKYTC